MLNSGVMCLCLHLRKTILMTEYIEKRLESVGGRGREKRLLSLIQVKESGGFSYTNSSGYEEKTDIPERFL